jgi:carboxyl-terminal processing protease
VFANGPAAKAGIVAGTIITAVNQESMLGKSVEEAISRLTGPVDSSVTIQILEQSGKISSLTLKREAVMVPVVNRKMLYGQVGYIRITSFSDNVGSHFEEAMTSLKVDGAKSFIVDLRNNGGGFVSSARDIVGYFPHSPMAYHLFYKERDELVASTKQSTTLSENTKLLINKYSASASEMTAAAVKDQQSAVLYGQNSFGKGSMQSYLEISNGDVMKLTVAEFTGPNGTQVNHVGVAPDKVTDKGLELTQAHLDEVESNLSTYNKLTSLSEISLDKTFNIKFSQPMMNTDAESAIELVELGGTVLPVTLGRINSKNFTVKPNALLKANKKYLVIIHPKMKNYKSM